MWIANEDKSKSAPKFASKRFKVLQKFRGDLTLEAEDGALVRRHSTFVKKITGPEQGGADEDDLPPSQANLAPPTSPLTPSAQPLNAPPSPSQDQQPRRSSRKRKPNPRYDAMYVELVRSFELFRDGAGEQH